MLENVKKMLVRKLSLLTQIILFFDKEFNKLIINPYFYQSLFSALVITNDSICNIIYVV